MVVDGAAPGGREYGFSRVELVEVLGGTALSDSDRAAVLDRADLYVQQRERAKREAEFTNGVVSLVALYERVEGDGVDATNREDRYQVLRGQAQAVLRAVATLEEPSEVAQTARGLAAFVHVCLARQSSREIDIPLLTRAGLREEDVIAQCQQVLVQAAIDRRDDLLDFPSAEQAVRETYPTLRSIRRAVPHIWERIVRPLAADLRARLHEAGYELPVLDERGQHPDDE